MGLVWICKAAGSGWEVITMSATSSLCKFNSLEVSFITSHVLSENHDRGEHATQQKKGGSTAALVPS